MKSPKISVIIPTYNRAQMVCDCVRSVLATDYPALEVIVVDDCSPDDTREKIAAAFGGDSRVIYLRNEKNKLLAVTRNVGARVASGDYLFFLDDDNIVDKNILVELTKGFERHPSAGLIAPLAVNERIGAHQLIWSLGNDFNPWTSKPVNKDADLPIEKLPAAPTDYPTTYSCNAFMVPRKVHNIVNGADESLVMVYEESDFGWRILEAGHDEWIITTARTLHLGYQDPHSTPQLRILGIHQPLRTYYFARNRLRFARKHFNLLQILSVTIVFAPLSCAYYCLVALKNRRPDIAWAYLRGTLAGILGL